MFVLNHWKVSYELLHGRRVIGGGVETVSLGRAVELTKGMELITEAIGERLHLDRRTQVVITSLQ